MGGQYIDAMLARAIDRTLCAVCRRWSSALVCAHCVALHAPAAPRCSRCALRLTLAGMPCVECVRAAPPQSRTTCAADYAFPWDGLLRRFKFDAQVELAAPLASLLQRAIQSEPPPDLVVPVPLSRQRLAERGYNQAWLLAQRLARGLHLVSRADVLERWVDTPGQARLDRSARLANLRAAFGVDPARLPAIRGRTVAVVDDVMTTGATVAECARVLLAAGAVSVVVWAVARTPGD